MLLLLPLIAVVILLAAAVTATGRCRGAGTPPVTVDQHGYRMSSFGC